ncbi:hypothetical protein [Arthrobacter sp. Helios]|uniref:CG0192-related protein n=1 Tax=Arthrobacter sp. Helios TaxID=2828862 RepID=UPI00206E2091|nr:hypothetical protein [Arthrobacter sp. Helios]UPO78534.1 hypothetical protein ArtHe_07680 [Arthrobacter sp. Helios]
MARIYSAELRPGKMELISQWLPKASWFPEDGPVEAEPLGAYRFDDPAGQIGIETHLVRAGSHTVQVPLTYRGAPLAGADDFLVGTMEHSVLGRRWVYDACGDPVYTQEFAAAVIDGRDQAPLYVEEDGVGSELAPTVELVGSGMPDGEELVEAPDHEPGGWVTSTLRQGDWELSVVRLLDLGGRAAPPPSLAALWKGQREPVVLGWALPLG